VARWRRGERRLWPAGGPGPFLEITAERVNRLPKWAREYLDHVDTFVGAQEVQEIFYLRDQNRALIKLVSELKAENRGLSRRA
jgi:hypothetical protein